MADKNPSALQPPLFSTAVKIKLLCIVCKCHLSASSASGRGRLLYAKKKNLGTLTGRSVMYSAYCYDESNLGREGFEGVAHCGRAGKARKSTGHTASVVQKQKEMNVGSTCFLLFFFLYLIWDPIP